MEDQLRAANVIQIECEEKDIIIYNLENKLGQMEDDTQKLQNKEEKNARTYETSVKRLQGFIDDVTEKEKFYNSTIKFIFSCTRKRNIRRK